jgi:hypothetical protein
LCSAAVAGDFSEGTVHRDRGEKDKATKISSGL